MAAKTPLNSLLAGALEAAKRGFRVHPGHPDSKKPTLPGWPKKATTNEKQIGEWWIENPDSNVAIATGIESGVIVLDVDGDDGKATIAELESVHGPIETLTAKTPNGLHSYFSDPGYAIKNQVKFLPGLDLRADGGYVIAPPSVVNGETYCWANGLPLSPCPDWLIAAVTTVSPKLAHADKWQSNMLDGVPEGTRDTSIFLYACRLRGKNLGKEEATALVLEKAANCDPPFPEAEALKKVEQAWKYETTFPLNDLGNAKRFTNFFTDQVKFDNDSANWLIRNGDLWHYDQDGQIVRFAKSCIDTIAAEAINCPDDHGRKLLRAHGKASGNLTRITALLQLAQSEPGIPILSNDLDCDPFLIGVENGVLNIKTGSLQKTDTVLTKTIPVSFDPSAQCPKWIQFMNTIFGGDQELMDFIQCAIGYALSGLVTEQCFFFLWGTGANGKTTMLNTLRYLLGDYAATMPAGALMVNRNEDHFAFARLRGIRFACAAEIEDGKRLHESKIKELTGGDRIVARFLYQNFFEFKPQFKIFMAGNHKPTIRGNDHAMWRRVKLIPFLVTIPAKEQDPNLEEKLRAEAAGILNWALEGFKVLIETGLRTPPAVKNATAEYKSQMDTLGAWFSECCCKDKSVKTSHKELFQDYKKWAEDNNEWQMTGKKFSQLLVERGIKRVRLKSGIHFCGLRLKPKNSGQ